MPRCFRWIGSTLFGPRALEGLVVLMAWAISEAVNSTSSFFSLWSFLAMRQLVFEVVVRHGVN